MRRLLTAHHGCDFEDAQASCSAQRAPEGPMSHRGHPQGHRGQLRPCLPSGASAIARSPALTRSTVLVSATCRQIHTPPLRCVVCGSQAQPLTTVPGPTRSPRWNTRRSASGLADREGSTERSANDAEQHQSPARAAPQCFDDRIEPPCFHQNTLLTTTRAQARSGRLMGHSGRKRQVRHRGAGDQGPTSAGWMTV